MKLTDSKCKNAKAEEKPYKLFDGKGLFLEIRPNGSKYFRLKYRYLGKEKLMALGVYPEISLSDARNKCIEARKLLDQNIDPGLKKKKDKLTAQNNAENTFETIAREWHENKRHSWTEKHGKTTMHRLEKDIFPAIGNIPIREVTSPMLLSALKKIEARGAFEPAHRMKQTCGQIFRYGMAKGVCDGEPSAPLKEAMRPLKFEHYASIDSSEIPELLSALDANKACLKIETRLAIEMLMLTFVRTTELIEAKWSEFNFEDKVWIIPPERMKMRKEHIVPLSRQVIAILKELKAMHGFRELVFPGRHSALKPISNNTIRQGLDRLGFKGRMTGHGFRALAMTTIKEKLGYKHEVIDRQLSHVPKSSVDRAYDRAKFLDDRKVMMQDWADYIDKCRVNGKVLRIKGE